MIVKYNGEGWGTDSWIWVVNEMKQRQGWQGDNPPHRQSAQPIRNFPRRSLYHRLLPCFSSNNFYFDFSIQIAIKVTIPNYWTSNKIIAKKVALSARPQITILRWKTLYNYINIVIIPEVQSNMVLHQNKTRPWTKVLKL